MRRNLLLACASLAGLYAAASALASAAGRTGSTSAKVQEEIKQIERERNQAILAADATALDRMTAEDYTFITQRGELRTKADILAGFKAGSFRYSARDVSDLTVRVYGDAAVVTGRARQTGTENSSDYSGENRFTRVYVRQADRWVTVALQVTLVEKP
jgi:ketosteroid isomerase-like protein